MPQINAEFASARWLAVDFVPTERVGSYAIVDLDVAYTSADTRWSVTPFVHNIADKAAYSGGGEQAFVPPAGVRHHHAAAHLRGPRQLSLSLRPRA